ncbi:MAG: hypothetical protein ACREAA_06475 [Candidatus Polarisedimenticolia bacterium]
MAGTDAVSNPRRTKDKKTTQAAWHIITGEYPPQPGGVADYCAQLAHSLAVEGDVVHVWTPPGGQDSEYDRLVHIHRLPGHFDRLGLRELRRGLDASPAPRRILVQYVAGAFGYRAMNLPFSLSMALRRHEPMWVMFHEYAYPLGWRLKPQHNLLGMVTSILAGLLAWRADRILVSTPSWIRKLPPFLRRSKHECITWLPIPSNIPVNHDPGASLKIRQRLLNGGRRTLLGHFGTYGPLISGMLREILPMLLAPAERAALLMGRGGEAFVERMTGEHPHLKGRLFASGALEGAAMADHLKACDMLVQPYDDGVTSRRGTLMAGLALGLPIVTNGGRSAEPSFAQEGAVAMAATPDPLAIAALAERTLASEEERARLSRRAASLYQEKFSIEHSIRTLRELAARDEVAS